MRVRQVLSPRVGFFVDLHEPGLIHFGVDLGRGQAGMAKQFLDRAQVAARLSRWVMKEWRSAWGIGVLASGQAPDPYVNAVGTRPFRSASSSGTMRVFPNGTPFRHSGESRSPGRNCDMFLGPHWIPAFAGMTGRHISSPWMGFLIDRHNPCLIDLGIYLGRG